MGLFGGIGKVLGGGLVGLLSGSKSGGEGGILGSVPLFGLLGEHLLKQRQPEGEPSGPADDDWWRTLMAARSFADGDHDAGLSAMPGRRRRRHWGDAPDPTEAPQPGPPSDEYWWGRG